MAEKAKCRVDASHGEAKTRGICGSCAQYVCNHRADTRPDVVAKMETIKAAMLPSKRGTPVARPAPPPPKDETGRLEDLFQSMVVTLDYAGVTHRPCKVFARAVEVIAPGHLAGRIMLITDEGKVESGRMSFTPVPPNAAG